MSRESRRQRGAKYAEYKRMRAVKIKGREKAKEQATKKWSIDQRKIGEVIGAIIEYYGDENFHRSAWTSEELLDEYERIFTNNEKFSKIKEEDVYEINRKLEESGIPAQLIKAKEPELSINFSDMEKELIAILGF